MKDFVVFLLTKVYRSKPIPENITEQAFYKTVADVKYHFPELDEEEISRRIESNSNELAIFLYRLGNELHLAERHELKPQIHWLLKELCGCEIYFNNTIGEGFYVVHGGGMVLGSRNSIGKGFVIHQGCTVGHRKNGQGNGSRIGDHVKMYANSSIVGELIIGDRVTIGGHVLVQQNIEANHLVTQKHELMVRKINA